MFRKSLAAVLATLLLIASLFAEEFKGVFKKYEDGKATIEVDGKNVEYPVSKDAKFKAKNGAEILLTDVFSRIVKEGARGSFVIENGMITKVAPAARKESKQK